MIASASRCCVSIATSFALVAVVSQLAGAYGLDEPGEPIALFGSVPAEATTVEILALPDLDDLAGGDEARSFYVEDAVVEITAGRYAAFIDPASIPTEYVAEDGAGASDSEAFWADPGANAALLVGEDTAADRATSIGLLGPRVVARAALAEVEVEDDGTRSWNDFVVDGDFDARSGCTLLNTGETTVRSTTIGTSYPVGDTKGRMVVSSSDGAKYGIGLDVDSDGAGFSASGSKFTQSGWSFAWAWEGANRSFRKSIEYTKFRLTCGSPGAVVRQTSWRPTGETGGVGNNYSITVPNWSNCQNAPAGTWSRDSESGSAYSYGAAVKFASVIGIDLGISRQYSATQKLEYRIPNTAYKLCGSNNYPATASKIQTKRR